MANFQLNFLSNKEIRESSSIYLEQWGASTETNESWKEEYKNLKDLKKHELELLDKGAKSQSQAWLLNKMWSDWKEIKMTKPKPPSNSNLKKPSKEWEKAFVEWKRKNAKQVESKV